MAEITSKTQLELRSEIETEFGKLFELLIDYPPAYKLTAQINAAFDKYAGNAELLTEPQLEPSKGTPQL